MVDWACLSETSNYDTLTYDALRTILTTLDTKYAQSTSFLGTRENQLQHDFAKSSRSFGVVFESNSPRTLIKSAY
jgi:hypothetical protein